jgi:hypothetical protein
LRLLPPVHKIGHGALFALQQAAKNSTCGEKPGQAFAGACRWETGEQVKNVSRFSLGAGWKTGPLGGSVRLVSRSSEELDRS